jgi:hypothetical protein
MNENPKKNQSKSEEKTRFDLRSFKNQKQPKSKEKP